MKNKTLRNVTGTVAGLALTAGAGCGGYNYGSEIKSSVGWTVSREHEKSLLEIIGLSDINLKTNSNIEEEITVRKGLIEIIGLSDIFEEEEKTVSACVIDSNGIKRIEVKEEGEKNARVVHQDDRSSLSLFGDSFMVYLKIGTSKDLSKYNIIVTDGMNNITSRRFQLRGNYAEPLEPKAFDWGRFLPFTTTRLWYLLSEKL